MKHLPLIIIIAAFIGLASLYSALVPLGEGPDEPGHAAYVFFLARERRLPDQRASEVPGEGHQPPLAYALAAPLAAWLPPEQRMFDQPANPRFTWAGSSTGSGQAAELNAVAHGSREFWPWRGAALAWHLARLVSVLCGAATVAFTYLAARALIDGRRKTEDEIGQSAFILHPSSFIPLLAAALVAFNPQFLFMSALATNDALLAMLSAALLWLALRRPAGTRAGAMRHALLVGLLLGLALLAKQSALLLAPVAVFSVLEHSWRGGATGRGRTRANANDEHVGRKRLIFSSYHLVILSPMLLFAAATLAISGWWYARNLRLYGDLFGLAMFRAEFATQAFDPRSPAAWLGALAQLHSSFWARFGWMNVPAPDWVGRFFIAIEALALIGWARWGLRDRETRRQGDGETMRQSRVSRLASRVWPGWWPLLALPLLALGWVVSFALTAGLVAWQGRLLFPALPAIAILLALGIEKAKGKRQKAKGLDVATFYLLPFIFAAIAAWLPFGAIRPAYTFYTLPEATALARLGEPTYARLGEAGAPGAELLGWRAEQPLRAGAPAEITLMWHAAGRQSRDWTVFIHLMGAGEQILAKDDTPPRAGAFPMTQWVAGDWVEDTHTLLIPAGLPPGDYRLRVGLFDKDTGERAGVFSRRGRLLGDHHLVTKLRVN